MLFFLGHAPKCDVAEEIQKEFIEMGVPRESVKVKYGYKMENAVHGDYAVRGNQTHRHRDTQTDSNKHTSTLAHKHTQRICI